MGYCDSILKNNILPACEGNAAGFEATGYLMERSSIDFSKVALDESNKAVIKTMPLLTGKKAYKVGQLKDPFKDTNTKLAEGTYRNTYDHEVHFAILDSSMNATDAADVLANGEFVMILEQKANNGDATKFRVYGYENGLRATANENNLTSEDGNIWGCVLTEKGSSKSAYYLYNTDVATTRTALESMVSGT